MPKKQSDKPVNEAARLLGKRSAVARKKQLGSKAFETYMRELGKRGGRPRKTTKSKKGRKK
jgi:hypothetical protein